MQIKTLPFYILLALIVSLAILPFSTPYMAIASFAYLLLLAGFVLRKIQRQAHVYLMSTGIVMDLSLVLVLEFQRDAIATALEFSLTPLQQAHIAMSSMATLLYVPLLIMGTLLYRKGNKYYSLRPWHKKIGIAAFIFRTLGFILMFALIGHVQPSN